MAEKLIDYREVTEPKVAGGTNGHGPTVSQRTHEPTTSVLESMGDKLRRARGLGPFTEYEEWAIKTEMNRYDALRKTSWSVRMGQDTTGDRASAETAILFSRL